VISEAVFAENHPGVVATLHYLVVLYYEQEDRDSDRYRLFSNRISPSTSACSSQGLSRPMLKKEERRCSP
jgi:hypothetical protein